MNKPIIAIVGPSGSGKSTSIRNLPVESTEILDLEMKGFPFREADKFKIVPCDSTSKFDAAWKACLENPKLVDGTVIIESFTAYTELALVQAALVSSNDGYKTYAALERMTGAFLKRLKNNKFTVIVTAIDEIVKVPQVDGTEKAVKRIATKGRAWEGKVEKEFLLCLFTEMTRTKEGVMQYNFQTNTDGVTSSKSPLGMFASQLIPNDLAEVVKGLKEYYK